MIEFAASQPGESEKSVAQRWDWAKSTMDGYRGNGDRKTSPDFDDVAARCRGGNFNDQELKFLVRVLTAGRFIVNFTPATVDAAKTHRAKLFAQCQDLLSELSRTEIISVR